ncbi:LLM class flavin-dependent oxidoreductase [Actinomycetospora aeridis]|uniref:LLM class flavin-dependent oxidoreductase n=1 Tax=Actinomycetospora aeridis TaxID=3129231 RepID=A0ABU8NBM3_9PSEU
MSFAEILADATAREEAGEPRVLIRDGDVFVLAAAVAARTATIRIGVAVDTARTHPYVAARKLAALDKISLGRAEWLPEDSEPARRDEAVHLVEALLASWGPGATVNDRERGVHVDTDRITAVHHDGRWWSVHSPLDVPAGPQGVVPRVVA